MTIKGLVLGHDKLASWITHVVDSTSDALEMQLLLLAALAAILARSQSLLRRSSMEEPAELPDLGAVALYLDPATCQWFLRHRVTGISSPLPASRSSVWSLHFSGGDGFVTDGEQTLWCKEVLGVRVLVDDDGRRHIMFGEDEAQPLQTLMEANDSVQINVTCRGVDSQIAIWVFKHSWAGARCWWSVPSLFAMAPKFGKMCVRKWTQSWWPWWEKYLQDKLRLDSCPHMRRARPTTRKDLDVPGSYFDLRERVLDETSFSSFALVPLLTRWACSRSRKLDDLAAAHDAWGPVLESLVDGIALATIKSPVALYLEADAICEAGLPLCGSTPFELPVVGKLVDCRAFLARTAGPQNAFQGLIKGPARMRMSELLRELHCASCAKGVRLFRQLCHVAASALEDSVLFMVAVAKDQEEGARRAAQPVVHTIDEVVEAATQSQQEAANPSLKGKCHAKVGLRMGVFQSPARRMWRYYLASRRHFHGDVRHLSVALDACRLNRMGIMSALVADPANVAAWMAPQVLPLKSLSLRKHRILGFRSVPRSVRVFLYVTPSL